MFGNKKKQINELQEEKDLLLRMISSIDGIDEQEYRINVLPEDVIDFREQLNKSKKYHLKNVEEMNELRKENEYLKENVKALDKEVKSLKKDYKDLEESKDKLSTKYNNKYYETIIKSDVEELKTEIDNLRMSNQALLKAKDNLEKELDKANERALNNFEDGLVLAKKGLDNSKQWEIVRDISTEYAKHSSPKVLYPQVEMDDNNQ